MSTRSTPARVTVPPVATMNQQTFRLHMSSRHNRPARVGYWDRDEHAADHQLNGELLDHVHPQEASRDTWT